MENTLKHVICFLHVCIVCLFIIDIMVVYINEADLLINVQKSVMITSCFKGIRRVND